MTKQDILQQCIVVGNIIKLPEEQLDRKLYLEVAQSLQLIGGKWKGGKIFGFVFQEDPTELLKQIANGEQRNLKKEFQFFATPDSLADELVQLANIEIYHSILEPSAGQGAIIDAILRKHSDRKHSDKIQCFELMPVNISILQKRNDLIFMGEDFLKIEDGLFYDRIIANPPFTKNQDIEHIYKMWECLNPGGKIVTLASTHWLISNNKKETGFKDWIENVVKGTIQSVPADTFKESGTPIATTILVINKPNA